MKTINKKILFNGVKAKTYKIYTLGCKVNQYDSGKLAARLEQSGLIAVTKYADIAIINSCAVTQTAINKSRRMIKLARKQNPGAKIVMVGCLAKLDGIKNNKRLLSFQPKPAPCRGTGSRNPGLRAMIAFSGLRVKPAMTSNRARYFIKIQDGCEQYCTYCIVPYVRGKLRSRPEREVIEEIKQAIDAGFREIVLSGIHLGLYGADLSLRGAPATKQSPVSRRVCEIASLLSVARNDKLSNLLKKLVKIKNLGRIRLSSIEVNEITDEIIKLMRTGKVCKHLHIPLQSGSDKILKLMNRPYSIKNYELRITNIRKLVPDIAITTDVIVGFPGETEKDFQETKNFIKKMRFSRLHVFPFSPHPQLPAAKLPGQIKENEKLKRAGELRKLGVKLAADYMKKFKGRKLEIVIEQIKADKIIGKTEYYFDVEVDKKKLPSAKIGELVKI